MESVYFYNYETKWDRKIRKMLWDDRSVDLLVERGREKWEIRQALGILLTSEQSHKRAYETLEAEMIDLLYEELRRMAELYSSLVNERLSRLLPAGSPLHDQTNAILLSNGAKRLRAYLFVNAADMFGGSRDVAVSISMVYELFHGASLIHDNIMNGARLRRGQETLHVKYGVPDAIITGDFMIFKAYHLLADHAGNPSPSQLQMLLKIVGETGEKCYHGQSLDMELARGTSLF